MRRSVTVAEPLHNWIQQIRAEYLKEYFIDLSYTAALNYYLAYGLCRATKMKEKEGRDIADQIFHSEEIDVASIEDEIDNVWLARELPKIIEKAQTKEVEKETESKEESKFSLK